MRETPYGPPDRSALQILADNATANDRAIKDYRHQAERAAGDPLVTPASLPAALLEAARRLGVSAVQAAEDVATLRAATDASPASLNRLFLWEQAARAFPALAGGLKRAKP